MNKVLLSACLFGLTSMASFVAADGVITLESTFVGDREQPAVSFFIPWQSPSGPDSLYLDVESQILYWLDEADRREMSRLYDFYANLDQTVDVALPVNN